jgi:hypothetical protein
VRTETFICTWTLITVVVKLTVPDNVFRTPSSSAGDYYRSVTKVLLKRSCPDYYTVYTVGRAGHVTVHSLLVTVIC